MNEETTQNTHVLHYMNEENTQNAHALHYMNGGVCAEYRCTTLHEWGEYTYYITWMRIHRIHTTTLHEWGEILTKTVANGK